MFILLVKTVLLILILGSLAYYLTCLIAARRFFSQPVPSKHSHLPPATIMIPLCGADFEAYANYASFCLQEYPDYQIVFGITSPEDSSAAVIRKLIADFPSKDIILVIGPESIGANPKVNNLYNMLAKAKHEIIVLVDSDIRVEPHYLATIVSELIQEGVGLVTCLYRPGRSSGLPSKLEAVGISTEFTPSVLVAWLIEGISFAFGATIATTKEKLESIGGLARIADYLADDYKMGQLIAQSGHKVKLSSYIVQIMLPPMSFLHMMKHQVRWARGIRACRPWGYLGSLITHGTVLAFLNVLVSGGSVISVFLFAATLTCRFAVAWYVGIKGTGDIALRQNFYLIPLRDVLGFIIWSLGQTGKRVIWRGKVFCLIEDGKMISIG